MVYEYDARRKSNIKVKDYDYNDFVDLMKDNKQNISNFTDIFHVTPYLISEKNDDILSFSNYNKYVDINMEALYNRCKNIALKNILLYFKEEFLKDIYVGTFYNPATLGARKKALLAKCSDTLLLKFAYTLTASSYYGFKIIPNPSNLGLSEGLEPEEYYDILKNIFSSMKSDQKLFQDGINSNNEDKENEKENKEENNKSNNVNKDENKDSNEDSDNNNTNNEDENNENNENDKSSNNSNKSENSNKESNNSSDKVDKSKASSNSNSKNEENSDNDSNNMNLNANIDGITKEDIIEFFVKKNIENPDMLVESIESTTTEDYINSLVLYGFFNKNKNDIAKKFFNKIEKYIINSEEVTTIVRSSKKPSYMKYSWKTHDRNDGIIYPGKKKITGGVSKKFDKSPIIFVDISGSTRDINKQLNDIIIHLIENNYTVCTYNHDLVKILEPNCPFLYTSSDGGTNTMRCIDTYFAKKLETNNIWEHPEIYDSHIYVITDGNEDHRDLFSTYKNVTLFQIKTIYNQNNSFYYEFTRKIAVRDNKATNKDKIRIIESKL